MVLIALLVSDCDKELNIFSAILICDEVHITECIIGMLFIVVI